MLLVGRRLMGTILIVATWKRLLLLLILRDVFVEDLVYSASARMIPKVNGLTPSPIFRALRRYGKRSRVGRRFTPRKICNRGIPLLLVAMYRRVKIRCRVIHQMLLIVR